MSPETLVSALAELVASGDFQVPPYPAVALKLQRLFARDNYRIGEVSDAVSADAALAARVLGVANSALYRGAEDITSLPRAVNRLGAQTVSTLALAASLGASATRAGLLFDVKYRAWRRSVTCALVSQKLAPLRKLDANEAFVAGLIHGFGRSVAIAALEKIVAKQPGVPALAMLQWLAIAEERRGELALAVGKLWQLPGEIMSVLGVENRATALGALVADAEQIASQLEGSWRGEAPSPGEARALEELVKGLPAALDALAAVPPAEPGRAPATAVAPSEHALKGERRPFHLPVADCRKQKPASLRATAISETGLVVTSSVRLQEAALVRVAVGSGEERAEHWFNVLTSVVEKDGCKVELELFAPTREAKERWGALFAR